MTEALKPSPALLCKLGSIILHVDEMFSLGGHDFDRIALEQLIADSDVKQWIQQMDRMSLLPKKRTIEDLKLAASRKSPRKMK